MSFEDAPSQISFWRVCRLESGTFFLVEMRMKYDAGTYRAQEAHPDLPGGRWDFDGTNKLFCTPTGAPRRDIGRTDRLIRIEGKRLGTNGRLVHVEYWTKSIEIAEAVRDALMLGFEFGVGEWKKI